METGEIEEFIRDCLRESGAGGVVIGISGGIDSAVAAALCVRALRPSRVLGLLMPSSVTPPEDMEDAEEVCTRFSIPHITVSIEPVLEAYRRMPGFIPDRRLEGNLMARTRMAVLYYHANARGWLVCGTTNRTEFMVGYGTKFGDTAADFQPILHLYKTDVRECARTLGIPERIIEKPPRAGLWPGQRDEDELGLTYEEIDAALISLERSGWRARDPVEARVRALVVSARHKQRPPRSLIPEYRRSPDSPRDG
ncbi:MAG: NAD+ synthase [Methanoculleaceae archaeon]